MSRRKLLETIHLAFSLIKIKSHYHNKSHAVFENEFKNEEITSMKLNSLTFDS